MSDPNGDAFSITDAQINIAGVLAFACTIPGTCICFLVLVAYAIAACFPKARKNFDRVSFRLLIYTLVFNVLFGIAYAATPTSPGPGCNFGAFAVNFTLSFSTFFTTCIAINLQLVLVHGVNGTMMEKYYLIGTTILSLVLNVPTYALHQFGWDEDSATCWYKNHDPKIRLRWIIGTQSFWIALAATIETLCSCAVLFWMYRVQRTTDALEKATSHSLDIATTIKDTPGLRPSGSSRSTFVRQVPRYRKVILRISLYPIISLMVNYSTVILDLNMTVRGLNTQLDFRLLVLDLILYGVRTLAYGVLAAMDPSFTSAIREIRGPKEHGTRETGPVFTSVNYASWGSGGGSTVPPSILHEDPEGGQFGVDGGSQGTPHSEDTSVTFAPEDQENAGVPLGFKFEEIREIERQL